MIHAYTPGEPGTISIVVANLRPNTVRITFSDQGRGIAPQNLTKIFDPFFTTGRERGSTGLGLHIVYNLVTARLQGTIDVTSRVGGGTRFIIDLPVTVTVSGHADTAAAM
jgi:signal transduction histidine kinase